MPDIGSQTIDTLIGLMFVFFLLSLVASAVTEAVAWLTQRRARDLEKGMRSLISDPTTLNDVLDHPLIKNMAAAADPMSATPTPETTEGASKPRVPSYIAPRDFALALLDTIAPPDSGTLGSRDLVAAARKAVSSPDNPLPSDLKKQLGVLLEDAGAELAELRASIERWFDSAMDRVSGWYKRWAQVWICIVALVVTLVFNVSAVRIADRLWNDDAVRSAVAGAATTAVEQQDQTAPTTTDEATEAGTARGQGVENAVSQLDSLELPIGWSDANNDIGFSAISGWLITFIAVSMGAPFWWDALSRLARLRTTGAKPSGQNGGGGT